MALVKFISGEGVEDEVEETSMAAEIMRKAGFMVVSIDGERQPISAIEPEAAVDLTKLNRTELIAEAKKQLGIDIDPADKKQTKAVIIDAILAADSDD